MLANRWQSLAEMCALSLLNSSCGANDLFSPKGDVTVEDCPESSRAFYENVRHSMPHPFIDHTESCDIGWPNRCRSCIRG